AFFLEQIAVQKFVDLPLSRGPAVIRLIDRARQSDELIAKIFVAFEVADIVLDVPERGIDLLELKREFEQARRRLEIPVADALQNRMLATHIGEFRWIGHAFELDIENSQLVDELARGNFHQKGHALLHIALDSETLAGARTKGG